MLIDVNGAGDMPPASGWAVSGKANDRASGSPAGPGPERKNCKVGFVCCRHQHMSNMVQKRQHIIMSLENKMEKLHIRTKN